MCALTKNGNKRNAESQPSSYNLFHISKKPKSSFSSSPSSSTAPIKTSKNAVSRLSLYPQQITPIPREIHAPCRVISGFIPKFKRFCYSFSNRMGNTLLSKCNRAKRSPISRKIVILDVDNNEETVRVDDDDSGGGSSVEVVEMVEDGIEGDDNRSVEVKEIVTKYMELERNEPMCTPFEVVSDMTKGKMLEMLSLNRGLDVMDVDMGLPLHKKLMNESAEKRDCSLRRLRFDIKLLETKLALQRQSRPAKKKEDVVNDPFRPLTEEEVEMVANVLDYSNRKKVLVTHENSNITITGEAMQCLRPRAWLNDEVINVYLELLKERETREPKKFLKCHFFNTFFYKKLISGRNGYDYNSVRRWTTQKKLGYCIFECDKIFVPIHKQIHWCLAVINKKEEKLQYLDSLGGADKKVLRALAQYITDEVKDKTGKDIDVTSWKQEFVTDLPNQENGYDCGMFMIKYADFYSRDIGLCFNQEHMPYFRLRTAKDILRLSAN